MRVLASGHGEKIQKNMPTCFKSMYPDCTGIDASEIKVQAPSSLVLNSEMYSSYESHTTYKGNVVISSSGETIHNSFLFEGSGNLVFCQIMAVRYRIYSHLLVVVW